MDAVEFLKERGRMCTAQDDCKACHIDAGCRAYFIDSNFSADTVKEMVSAVEQWAKEHPLKTRQSEFLNMFPNASMNDGILFCPKNLDTTYSPIHGCMAEDCYDCRRNYWFQEVE